MRRYVLLFTLVLLCALTQGILLAASSQATLAYSTFLGGTIEDQSNTIAVDSSGCAYVAGWTYPLIFRRPAVPSRPHSRELLTLL